MPTLSSRHFGPVEYQDDAVFEFPTGLPGFEQERRFLAIEHAASKPIVFLQSLNRPELCFITLPVSAAQSDYALAIAPEDLKALGLADSRQPAIGSEVICLAIVSVDEDRLPTANLLAPVVINMRTRRGLQAIQEGSSYSHQHPLVAAQPEEECS
jgi:flagellar assembly factor FliW